MNKAIYTVAQLLRRMGVRFHEEQDPRVQSMRQAIDRLGSIQFSIEVAPDGTWAAESTNIDGIITGGRSLESINEQLKDAVFTYFEIPPHLCSEALVKAQGEAVKFEHRVYA